MAGTGALAGPLPLRLGVIDDSGLDASDHARVCADLLGSVRTTPTLLLKATRSGANCTVDSYRGLYTEPTPVAGTGSLKFAIPMKRTLFDGTDVQSSPMMWHVYASGKDLASKPLLQIYSTAGIDYVTVLIGNGDTVTVVGYGASDLDSRTIASYGGATDKENCRTELVPYTWIAYRMIQDARGSSYSKELSGLVHVENQALARAHAARWRDCERLSTNANPATAYEKSEEWRQALAVRLRPNDTPESLRQRSAAKFLSNRGPTRQTVDDAVEKLLGNLYVKSWRLYGDDLATPPTETYWPGVNPGTPSYDLGGGPWYSERSHLVIEVTQPSDVQLSEFLDKMDQLYELLDRLLPATATFDWAVNVDDGFTLDVDQLDFGSLGRL